MAGGRTGLLRTAITAIGVALGVAVLLIAASIPAIHAGRQARGQARSDTPTAPAAHGGVLVADADTRFRGRDVRGRLLEGDVFPPGLTRAPRAGEVVVSPALRDVLGHAGRAAAARSAHPRPDRRHDRRRWADRADRPGVLRGRARPDRRTGRAPARPFRLQ